MYDILQGKKISFSVIDITQDSEKKDYLKLKTGAYSLPYLFKDGEPFLDFEAFQEAIEEGLFMEMMTKTS